MASRPRTPVDTHVGDVDDAKECDYKAYAYDDISTLIQVCILVCALVLGFTWPMLTAFDRTTLEEADRAWAQMYARDNPGAGGLWQSQNYLMQVVIATTLIFCALIISVVMFVSLLLSPARRNPVFLEKWLRLGFWLLPLVPLLLMTGLFFALMGWSNGTSIKYPFYELEARNTTATCLEGECMRSWYLDCVRNTTFWGFFGISVVTSLLLHPHYSFHHALCACSHVSPSLPGTTISPLATDLMIPRQSEKWPRKRLLPLRIRSRCSAIESATSRQWGPLIYYQNFLVTLFLSDFIQQPLQVLRDEGLIGADEFAKLKEKLCYSRLAALRAAFLAAD